MKHSEVIANKDDRLDTSAAQFDTKELLESQDRSDAIEKVVENPMENIDDISMAISHHIKTPKKVSDMRSSKPIFSGKTTKKKVPKN